MKQIGLWLCFVALVGATPGLHVQTDDCSPGLEPRLTIGELARVTPGDANNVRAEPAASADLVGQIPGEGVFTVLDGPACSGGLTWWQVRYGDVMGWTVEGSGDYWVEPLGLTRYADDTIRFAYDPDAMGNVEVRIREAGVSLGGPFPEQVEYWIRAWPAGSPDENVVNASINIVRTADITTEMTRFDPALKDVSSILDGGTIDGIWKTEHPFCAGVQQLGVALPQLTRFVNGEMLVYASTCDGRSIDVPQFDPQTYYFIGLTDDDAYMVHGSFRFQSPGTSVPFVQTDFLDTDYQAFDAYDEYAQQVAAELAQLPDDAFSPSLATLRQMIQSIEVIGDWAE